MSAHTPGRWARVKPITARHWTLGRIIDHVAHPLPEENFEADWSLAEAAPDLLEALRPFAESAVGDNSLCHANFTPPVKAEDCSRCGPILRGRAAIAKAEGR